MTTPDNTCGSGAGCLHKDARIEHLEAEVERLRAQVAQADNATLEQGIQIGMTRARQRAAAALAQQAEAPGFSSGVSAQAPGLAAPSLTVGGEPPQWPIAKLTVHEDDVRFGVSRVTAELYAPGLPPGQYDTFLEPAPAAQSEPVALPHPGSPQASAMIDSVLAEYQWPSNAKNAARAGYVAAMRLAGSHPPAQGTGHLTRFDAVQRALDLASLMGGSIGQNDRDSTEGYRTQLRDHLFACIPAAQAPAAEPLTVEQIDSACSEIYGSNYGGVLTLALQRAVARAIERAHRIGV